MEYELILTGVKLKYFLIIKEMTIEMRLNGSLIRSEHDSTSLEIKANRGWSWYLSSLTLCTIMLWMQNVSDICHIWCIESVYNLPVAISNVTLTKFEKERYQLSTDIWRNCKNFVIRWKIALKASKYFAKLVNAHQRWLSARITL